MSITGLSRMLSSNTTRKFDLSCGISLIARKQRIKDITQREDEIVRKRGCIIEKVGEVEKALASVKAKDVRDEILSGAKEAIREIITRPGIAYIGEAMEFELSSYGRAYNLMLYCQDNSELKELDDYITLVHSLDQVDNKIVDELLSWAAELDFLKNSDSPSENQTTETLKQSSSDGDA